MKEEGTAVGPSKYLIVFYWVPYGRIHNGENG